MALESALLRPDSLEDIDNNQTDLLMVGGSLLWRPGTGMSMLFSFEHAEDDSTGTYQGSPMVPADVAQSPSDVFRSCNGFVVDKATRHVNYNPLGGTTGANASVTAESLATQQNRRQCRVSS